MKEQKELNMASFEKEVNKLFKVERLGYEFQYKRTLWIYIVSEDFLKLGVQKRTHLLTDLIKKTAPNIFRNYLFGFVACTPKEWEKRFGGDKKTLDSKKNE